MSGFFMLYQDYLQTDHWKRLRKEALKRAGEKCELSGSTFYLHVHHLTYRSSLFDCKVDDLMVLSKEWHERVHRWIKDGLYLSSDSNKAKRAKVRLRYKSFTAPRYHIPESTSKDLKQQNALRAERNNLLNSVLCLEIKINNQKQRIAKIDSVLGA